MSNPYVPYIAVIEDIKRETGGTRPIKTFTTVFRDEGAKNAFKQDPGQGAMVGIAGVGESMISICSSPTQVGYLQFSIMKLGKVTSALHELETGDMITIRGPYGKPFPLDDWKGKNVLTIGGGIGQASLRAIVNYVLDNRQVYKRLDIIYGARSPSELVYLDELEDLGKGDAANVYLTVDKAAKGWNGHVGLVPQYLLELNPSPENTVAITCGPPIMIKFVLENLVLLGFGGDDIYTTLENRMKCGIGKCGRCNVGNVYVCIDGPVFSYSRLRTFLPDML